jgi:hypothetical protein
VQLGRQTEFLVTYRNFLLPGLSPKITPSQLGKGSGQPAVNDDALALTLAGMGCYS